MEVKNRWKPAWIKHFESYMQRIKSHKKIAEKPQKDSFEKFKTTYFIICGFYGIIRQNY